MDTNKQPESISIANEFYKRQARIEELEKELAEARAELAEARKDRERYQYIRTESLICWSQGKMKNLISWPTIRAVDRINGGNYRDRFDAAIDSARAREGKG